MVRLLFCHALFFLPAFGCSRVGLGIQPTDQSEVSPSEPVELHPPADELKGRSILNLVTKADVTVAKSDLDSQTIRDVAQEVSPSVVSIFTRTETPYRLKLLPLPTSGLRFKVDGKALGSGFFVHSSGYVLTNAHVLKNATEIVARTKDGKDWKMEIVAKDFVYDLALLKVVSPDVEFPVVSMGDSKEVSIGDWVIAVGNPLGLGHTVTHGIVSQTGRKLSADLDEGERQIEFLQTDTPINPGSSGGPLITLEGVFVGVNTAVIVNSQGISFCVPASQVVEFLEKVLKGEGVRK